MAEQSEDSVNSSPEDAAAATGLTEEAIAAGDTPLKRRILPGWYKNYFEQCCPCGQLPKIGELPNLCEKISILMQANVLIADWCVAPFISPFMTSWWPQRKGPISYQDVALC